MVYELKNADNYSAFFVVFFDDDFLFTVVFEPFIVCLLVCLCLDTDVFDVVFCFFVLGVAGVFSHLLCDSDIAKSLFFIVCETGAGSGAVIRLFSPIVCVTGVEKTNAFLSIESTNSLIL